MINDILDGAARFQLEQERANRDLIRHDLTTLLEPHVGRRGTASLILALRLVAGLVPSGAFACGGVMPISDRYSGETKEC